MLKYSVNNRLKDLFADRPARKPKLEYKVEIILQTKDYSKLVELVLATKEKLSLTEYVTNIIKDKIDSTRLDYKDREWKLFMGVSNS